MVSRLADGSAGEEWAGVMQPNPYNVFARDPGQMPRLCWVLRSLTGPYQSYLSGELGIRDGDGDGPSTVVVVLSKECWPPPV